MTKILYDRDGLINQYKVFIFDLWGVLHNGQEPFVTTIECLKSLKVQNKPAFLLSNSPRLIEPTVQRLEKMGIDKNLYQGIYTSGWDCHLNLRDRTEPFYQILGETLYHMGPYTYEPIFKTLDYKPISNPEQADFILISGAVEGMETLDDYTPFLHKGLERNLPLICANADKQAIFGKEPVLCAGLMAEYYHNQGGNVYIHGKPSPVGYQRIHQMAETTLRQEFSKSEILMIGDSLATDIKGANTYGIDSLMLLTGVHGAELQPWWNNPLDFEKKLKYLTQVYQSQPTYVMEHL